MGTHRAAWVTRMRRLHVFARHLIRRFHEDRCTEVAAALSYTTLLSLVPLTTVAVAAVSAFPAFGGWMQSVQNFIYQHFVPATGAEVQQYLDQFTKRSAQLTAAGLAFLVITAVMLMFTIEDRFNRIWRVPKRREPIHRFLIYWALLTLGPLLTAISLSASLYVVSRPLLASLPAIHWLRPMLRDGLPFALASVLFFLLYRLVPNAKVHARHAAAGALLAAFLFEIAKHLFAFLVIHYSSYRLIYGALAVLPVFLIWIYLSWLIILSGAVLCAALDEQSAGR